MKTLVAALRFLTIIPLPSFFRDTERDLARSVYLFPVVGLLLGALLALSDTVLSQILPVLPASVILVLMLIVLTGGLHIDGLADTADGFMSSRRRDRILEIMMDSRTGPMGVAAIAVVLILKVALLASVTGPIRPAVLVLMPTAGRSAMVMIMGMLSYARPEGGLGSLFMARHSHIRIVWGAIFVVLCGWFIAGGLGATAGLMTIAAAALAALYMYCKIGGLTGDTLGAACEVVELMPLLIGAIGIHRGLVS